VHGPRNTVVVDGSKATFTCLTDLDLDELCWDYRDEGGELVTVCNPDGCRSPRYSVDTSVNNDLRRHSFMIDSCNATHSGRYICGDCNDKRARKTAYLVVLGTSSTSLFKTVCPDPTLLHIVHQRPSQFTYIHLYRFRCKR